MEEESGDKDEDEMAYDKRQSVGDWMSQGLSSETGSWLHRPRDAYQVSN